MQGEVGRSQGIWKATGRQSAPACPHSLHSATSQSRDPPERSMGTNGLRVQYLQGLQLEMAREIPRAFGVGREDWLCAGEGVRAGSRKVGQLCRSLGHSRDGLGWGRWRCVLCKAQMEALWHSGMLCPTQAIRLTCPLGDIGGGGFK